MRSCFVSFKKSVYVVDADGLALSMGVYVVYGSVLYLVYLDRGDVY